MNDKTMLYNIIYALAARDGRDGALFGPYAGLATEAFERSLAGDEFPELWFELPLAGDPWFDLHALTSREALGEGVEIPRDGSLLHPEVFEWFASEPAGVRQLALSHDLSQGRADDPAVQLLVGDPDPAIVCRFLESAGRADATDAYRAFVARLPKGWFACYTGVFPGRPEMGLRVECIPNTGLQRAYASDAALLEEDLRKTGFDSFGDTILPRCQALARTPFQFEFQFDVDAEGGAGPTLGASARFDCPPGTDEWKAFEADGAGGELMREIESWGLADDRWRLFEDAMFAKKVKRGERTELIFNFLAFVKLRWRGGDPLDAKVYFMAGTHDEGE